MTTEYFVLARAVHFGACLLFFGIFAFDRLMMGAMTADGALEAGKDWRMLLRFFNGVLPPVILLSGAAWLALVSTTMSGQSLQLEVLKTVWSGTLFGAVWKIRLLFWLAGAVVAAVFFFSKPTGAFGKSLVWLQLLFSALLLGSLAFAGHGQEDSRWHLFADILHLLVAGIWPTGLLPLLALLRGLRRVSSPARIPLTIALVRRFSALSLVAVALLAATGVVNSWFLVGSFSNLFGLVYGRWLLAKIIFFCVAVAIGAVNLLRLKPRISHEKTASPLFEATAVRLEFNVSLELILAAIIILVVALLGLLPPSAG